MYVPMRWFGCLRGVLGKVSSWLSCASHAEICGGVSESVDCPSASVDEEEVLGLSVEISIGGLIRNGGPRTVCGAATCGVILPPDCGSVKGTEGNIQGSMVGCLLVSGVASVAS
jgi:hypothetical protein